MNSIMNILRSFIIKSVYIIADIPDVDEGIIAKLRPNLDHMHVSACAICESNKVLTVIKMVIEPDREEDQHE